jgi:hypothetical protein
MNEPAFAAVLQDAFGERARRNCPLAPLTTFRVGGAADWMVDVRTSDELTMALKLATGAGVPVTMLGGGSNVLVSGTCSCRTPASVASCFARAAAKSAGPVPTASKRTRP